MMQRFGVIVHHPYQNFHFKKDRGSEGKQWVVGGEQCAARAKGGMEGKRGKGVSRVSRAQATSSLTGSESQSVCAGEAAATSVVESCRTRS